MGQLTKANALTSANYANSTNGVTQTALAKYSAGRGNNLARSLKAVESVVANLIPGDGQTLNVAFAVGAGTIALKGDNGNDHSPIDQNDPLTTPGNEAYVRIAGVLRKITSAKSLTFASGTNWFGAANPVTNNLTIQLFVYAIWNSATSTVDLAVARVPYFATVSDRSATQTSERYMPIASDTGFSGTTPNVADKCVVIGRVDAKLNDNGTTKTWVSLSDYRPVVGNIRHTDVLDAKYIYTNATYSSGTTQYVYEIVGHSLTCTSSTTVMNITANVPTYIASPMPTNTADQFNLVINGVSGVNTVSFLTPVASTFSFSSTVNGTLFAASSVVTLYAYHVSFLLL